MTGLFDMAQMTDKELLECIDDIFATDIVVWKSEQGEGMYEPKGTKQDLYRKLYNFRLDFHNAMAFRRCVEKINKSREIADD